MLKILVQPYSSVLDELTILFLRVESSGIHTLFMPTEPFQLSLNPYKRSQWRSEEEIINLHHIKELVKLALISWAVIALLQALEIILVYNIKVSIRICSRQLQTFTFRDIARQSTNEKESLKGA